MLPLKLPKVLLCLVVLLISSWSSADAVDFKNRAIQIAMGTEPPDLNSLKATDQVSFFVIEHVMEGLLAYDDKGRLVPGIAERWSLNEEKATFYLRKNARWSDGVPVTAHDFVFAWQSVVNPETASRYAFILSPIKNAQAITNGEMPATSLGVKALDDFTLEVKLERPCAYFLSLTTFGTYLPVREDFYKQHQDRYFADVENMIFNGPFVLSEWVHGASLKLEKNPDFWNADEIKIDTISVPYISSDPKVIFNLFRNNEIVSAGLDTDTIKLALQERMQIKKFALGAVFYIEFNHKEGSVTANKNFRKALQSVFDPEDIVYKVIALPGNKPAYSMFPSWLQGKQDKFYREYPPVKIKPDFAAAREHLEQAKKELGIKEFPALVLLSSDSPVANKEAEYLQALLKDSLGLEIRIDKQIFKQRLAKMSAGEFDLVLAAWGPDYNDPSTFGDLFYSRNSNNHGQYKSKDYDHWVEIAMMNTDTKTRMDAFNEMQKLIYQDAVVLPIFERGIVFVEHPGIKNISRRIFGGDPSFRYAWLEQ